MSQHFQARRAGIGTARAYGVFEGATADALDLRSAPLSRAVLTGLRGLMFAVLQNGIHAYLRGKGNQRSEAEDWVRSRRRDSPFSFAVLCEEFALDPSAVRVTLARMRATAVRHIPIRARPYARRLRRIAAPRARGRARQKARP